MSQENSETVNRRGFLKAAAVTAVAATTTGAGAAFLRKSNQSATAITVPPAPPVAQTLVTGNEQIPELLAQLAAAQAENARLQADLESARRRWEVIDRANGESDAAVNAMSVELDDANTRIGVLAGLVSLYEQLESVDVTDWIEDGVTAVSEVISDLTDDLPSLSEGLEHGWQALAELDEQIPLLQNGRAWLEHQTDKLQGYFDSVEQLLETAVDRLGPFLQMFNQWVQDILKWLPFGLGQKTSAIMDAITNLLQETPHTISGLQTNVSEPLDTWLGKNEGEIPLRQNIITPLQERVLTKAGQIAEKSNQVHTSYQENVARRWETAVIHRQQIQNLIHTYRQQHKL